jgi:hypothetical protein
MGIVVKHGVYTIAYTPVKGLTIIEPRENWR